MLDYDHFPRFLFCEISCDSTLGVSAHTATSVPGAGPSACAECQGHHGPHILTSPMLSHITSRESDGSISKNDGLRIPPCLLVSVSIEAQMAMVTCGFHYENSFN